jgi:hypothetical protein
MLNLTARLRYQRIIRRRENRIVRQAIIMHVHICPASTINEVLPLVSSRSPNFLWTPFSLLVVKSISLFSCWAYPRWTCNSLFIYCELYFKCCAIWVIYSIWWSCSSWRCVWALCCICWYIILIFKCFYYQYDHFLI